MEILDPIKGVSCRLRASDMDSLKWLGLQSIVCELGRFMAINGPYFHQPYRDSSSRHVPVLCSDSYPCGMVGA